MRPGDLVVAEGGKTTQLWDNPPARQYPSALAVGDLPPGETAVVLETRGRGDGVCVRVLASNGGTGWNWETLFVVVRTR